jgi:DNA-nicking Smr family endonuclease
MRGKRPVVSSEDQALFLAAIEGTAPLSARDRVAVPPPPASTVRVVELPPEVKLAVEGDAHRYTARAPGVSKAQVAQLRAGQIHVEQTLDLHGETVERARTLLRELAVTAAQKRCVLIVHGKGLHSDHGAPLREAVLAELLGPLSGFVHALATAAPADGGEGATYVMLRGPR